MVNGLTLVVASAAGGIRAAHRDEAGWNVGQVLPGEDVRCIAIDPVDGARWFAGTQGNGAFVTRDRGATWNQIGPQNSIVKSLSVTASKIYAGTKPARIYASNDGGNSWRESESFQHIPGRKLWWSPAEPPGTAYVQSLDVSPNDPNVVLAGIELGAVVRSDDGGETWSRHLKGTLRDCHMLKFHHSDPHWAYEAGGTGGGASISSDGGLTWAKVKDGLDRHYAVACAADPEEPDLWYISVSPGPGKAHSHGNAHAHIFRSQGGKSWVKLGGGLPQPLDWMPYGLATVPDRPGLVIAALKNGQVWTSEDNGDNWSRLSVELGPIRIGLSVIAS